MKIVKSIIDNKNKLIGFWMEGKETEFGGFGSNVDVQRPVQLKELISKNFRNNQIAIKDGKVVPQNNFRISDLPMSRYDGTSNFISVDNRLFLTSRIVHDGKLIGFRIVAAGVEAKYKYDDVIRLTSWFKPGNFIVRTVGDKLYIAGKPGVIKLEDLPEEVIGENVQRSKKKRVGTGGQFKENIAEKGIYNNKDLITLYSIIKDFNGVVVKLPDEQYISANKADTKVGSDFRALGIGEIGNPSIQFGEKKLNANTTFKKVGTVMVPVPGGMPIPVYTYTFSTKSIFLNGENYIKRFAIGVKPEGAVAIKQEFEKEMAIQPITNKEFTDPIKQLTGNNDLVFFEVDTSKLSIIPPEKAKDYILTNKEIYDITYQIAHLKTHNKYCNGLKGEILNQANAANIKLTDKTPFGLYAGMAPEYLKAIHEAGIDIFTGAYVKREAIQGKAVDKPEVTSVSEYKSIEIEYNIKGTDISKLTYAMMASRDSHPMIDEFLLMRMDEFDKIASLPEKFKAVCEYQDGIEKALYDCKKKLWLHKLGMYYTQDGRIHQHDKDMWVQNVKSRSKANAFDCVEPGCEKLYVAVLGISI